MLDRSLGSPFARAAVVAAMALVPVPTAGQGLAEPVASATAQTVTFTDHIRPIMERSCWNCHGEAAQLSNLDLRTRDGALAGGTKGPAIVPGRADESRLYRQLAGLEQPAMPMDGSTLTDAEIAAVRTWIDDGAHWDTGGATSTGDALSVLEDAELPPGARDYWAFKLPVQAPVPAFSEPTQSIGFSRRRVGTGPSSRRHGRTGARWYGAPILTCTVCHRHSKRRPSFSRTPSGASGSG